MSHKKNVMMCGYNVKWKMWFEYEVVHKVCHAIFEPPSPSHKLSQILDPPLKVCHTSEQKVDKQISRRMETALKKTIIVTSYYILNNNKRLYSMGVSYEPWNTLTSLISYNSEGDSCNISLYYAW